MTISFAATAAEAFAELPQPTQVKAVRALQMLERQPHLYPVGRRGMMRGYRYFVAGRHLFYYKLSSQEIRIPAILPGAMRSA